MKNYVFWAIFLAFALISCTSNEFYEVNIPQNANLCKKTPVPSLLKPHWLLWTIS